LALVSVASSMRKALTMTADSPALRPTWAELGIQARAWRVAHAAWSAGQLTSLAYVWWSAIRRRRSRRLGLIVGFLLAEGAGLAVGRGNCPMGRQQAKWGDPVPFFELVLSPRAAKAAVPVLAVVTVLGIAGVIFRPPIRNIPLPDSRISTTSLPRRVLNQGSARSG
jgi:hypothetical protein